MAGPWATRGLLILVATSTLSIFTRVAPSLPFRVTVEWKVVDDAGHIRAHNGFGVVIKTSKEDIKKAQEDALLKAYEEDPVIKAIPPEERVPRLIIGGAQKGGTTSLLGILNQQEQFMMNTKRRPKVPIELRYFDSVLMRLRAPLPNVTAEEWQAFRNMTGDRTNGTLPDNVMLAIRHNYSNYWNFSGTKGAANMISMEKSPDYMIRPWLPVLLKQVAPWAKIIFVVREPSARAYSAYRMFTSLGQDRRDKLAEIRAEQEANATKLGIPLGVPVMTRLNGGNRTGKPRMGVPVMTRLNGGNRTGKPRTYPSFETIMSREIEALRAEGLTQVPTLEQFLSPDFVLNETSFALPLDMNTRNARKIADGRRVVTRRGKHGHLMRGMYAEHLQPWLDHFELGKNLLVISNERLKQDHLGVIHQVQRFVGANLTQIEADVLTKNYHGGYSATPLNATTQRYLELFFEPYNQELQQLMPAGWWDDHVGTRWDGFNADMSNHSKEEMVKPDGKGWWR